MQRVVLYVVINKKSLYDEDAKMEISAFYGENQMNFRIITESALLPHVSDKITINNKSSSILFSTFYTY